jgi:hypothetical protein
MERGQLSYQCILGKIGILKFVYKRAVYSRISSKSTALLAISRF